jgi:multidrug resistance efflux pump
MPESTQPVAKRSGRWVYLVGLLAFLAYAGWIMGPYLRSIIVRDATVTTWLNLSASPIEGRVEWRPIAIGQKVEADGVILQVENHHLSRHGLEEHEIRVGLARGRVQELENFLAEIEQLDHERADLKAQYARTFRAQLDAEIASLGRKIAVYTNRLEVMRKIAARKVTLASKGLVSDIVADEDALRVSTLEFDLTELQEHLDQAQVRRQAADKGVFINANGEDPAWVRGSRMELKLEKKRARLELRQAKAELNLAEADVTDAKTDIERLSKATVRVPPGSILWSKPVATGETVESGQTVAEWLDCGVLMIDVPVADAEVPLIEPGMEADVVLEGETVTRRAKVLITRGSASTLGRDDLAAVAKGRRDGVAQVLLDFSSEHEGFAECPVGRAAYVHFDDVGLIDVIRARLRL